MAVTAKDTGAVSFCQPGVAEILIFKYLLLVLKGLSYTVNVTQFPSQGTKFILEVVQVPNTSVKWEDS